MTGFESKRQAAQDKMELADAYASAVAATPNMPTPLERKLAVERIERARNALEAALEQQQDKLNDEADTLTIVYQRGFADGKRSAQRKPLTFDAFLESQDFYDLMQTYRHFPTDALKPFEAVKEALRSAHNIKEQL